MTATYRRLWTGAVALFMLWGLAGCSSDEDDLNPPPPRRETVDLRYENPVEIKVHSQRHWALLLHNRESSSGPALQLVDLSSRRVIRDLILDYYDVYDAAFLPGDQLCLAGRPQGNIGYAVQFFSLPDLTPGTRVLTAGMEGEHGYLAVDTVGGWIYYSHAGGGESDGIYRISIGNKTISDADRSNTAPFAFNNQLVSGLFNHPARLDFDVEARKLVVANTGADYVTFLDAALWGTLQRDGTHSFPIAGTSHLSSASGFDSTRAWAMCGAAGIYVFAGQSGTISYLSRFGTASNGLDFIESMPTMRSWQMRNADLRIHARQDIFSVFVVQRDTARLGIGQYRLNNLQPVAGSPYHMQTIGDSAIAALGVDVVSDKLIVGDAFRPRLEIINIEK